jgi:hypothetical protein
MGVEREEFSSKPDDSKSLPDISKLLKCVVDSKSSSVSDVSHP